MKNSWRVFLAAALLSLLVASCPNIALAQSYYYAYGSNPWTTPVPVPGGYVDAANGNLHIEIPIASMAERGSVPFRAALVYDSHIWQQVTTGSSTSWKPTNVINSNGGWRLVTSAMTGTINYTTTFGGICTVTVNHVVHSTDWYKYTNFTWQPPSGRLITFNISTNNATCGDMVPSGDALANDGSGYHMYVITGNSVTVYAPDGTEVAPVVKDPNGNFYYSGSQDTLGRYPVNTTTSGSTTTYEVLNSQGGTSDYVVTWETVPVSTSFGQTGVTECTSCAISAIQSIALPDGTSYQFTYDQGSTGTHYGVLTGMTLPTGGTISYSHENFEDAYNNHNLYVKTAAANGGTWTFAPTVTSGCPTSCTQSTTLTLPSGDEQTYAFGSILGNMWPSTETASDQTVNISYTTYSGSSVFATGYKTTETVPSGNLTKNITLTYDTNNHGTVQTIKEWNFGSTGTNPDRTTTYTYLVNSNKNIINKKLSAKLTNSAGTAFGETDITYDGNTLTSKTGVINHDDVSFPSTYTARGNPTLITTVPGITQTLWYDSTGQLVESFDNNSNITKFSYTDAYYNDNSTGATSATAAGVTNAFPTAIVLPTNWGIAYTYFLGTSQVYTHSDQNGFTTTNHYLDSLSRPTSTQVPINATNYSWKMMSYASSSEVEANAYTGIGDASPSLTCSSCRHDQINLDPFGRTLTQVLVSDPDGTDTVTASYDHNGRVASVTNPERSTSSPSDGSESYTYDGLNRITKVTHSDGSYNSTYYGAKVTSAVGGNTAQLCAAGTYGYGYPVLVVDEASKKRETWTDGFGRTIETDEPNSAGTLNVGTCYTYDVANNLLSVTQGAQTRSYVYDEASRVTSATTPESGTVSYYYTTSSGGPCSGNGSLVCRRTDARGITATYTYDKINRLTGITYSGSTHAVTYTYDAGTNQKGFRTGMTDGSGSTSWTYNEVGWPITEQRTIAAITNTISYTYNGDGSIATLTYPSGRMITYTTSNAQRPTSAQDIVNTVQYAVTASYAPPGQLTGVIYGPVAQYPTWGGTESASFNSRLQPTAVSQVSGAGTGYSLAFNYPTTGNNGMLSGVTNNVSSGLSESFTYDSLNRILSGTTTATSGTGCWGQSFGSSGVPDDRYSNLTQITVTGCSAGALGIAVSSATNRVTTTGFSYDAAGNMTSEPTPNGYTYTYDAENHLTQVSGTSTGTWTYVYDGNGLRVEKSNASGGTLYWRDVLGNSVAETDLTGSTTDSAYEEYVFFAGRRIAEVPVDKWDVLYYYADQIGSTVLLTLGPGQPCYEATFTPYGQEMATENTCSTNYKFTGYERDAETGLDYAFARYYNSRLGRFMSADLLGGDQDVPQSLNRYAYVGNSPVVFVDPLGLYCVDANGDETPGNDPNGCAANGGFWITVDGAPNNNTTIFVYGGLSTDSAYNGSTGIGYDAFLWITNFFGATRLGIRAPGQSFNQCMVQNAKNYSAGGAVDLSLQSLGVNSNVGTSFAGQVAAGNTFTGLYAAVAGSGEDAAGAAASSSADLINAGMGTVTTFGRRTSNILSLNLAGNGGLPSALSPASTAGAQSVLGSVSKVLSLGLEASTKAAVDAGLAGAEAIGCAIKQ